MSLIVIYYRKKLGFEGGSRMKHKMQLGLCSVTFRDKSPEEIISLAKQANLEAIEWGADIHVRPGDIEHATRLGKLTRKNGLQISSYGSYYKLGNQSDDFLTVLDTAKELQAPAIRVWAGEKGSNEADAMYRNRIIEDAKRIAAVANAENISIHLEFHDNTLTDTAESAKLLMDEIKHPNVFLYWQPPNHVTFEDRLQSIDVVKDFISNVHLFHWHSYEERMALSEGKKAWQAYLTKILQDNKQRFVLIEFIKGDSTEQFLQDAQTLHELKNALLS